MIRHAIARVSLLVWELSRDNEYRFSLAEYRDRYYIDDHEKGGRVPLLPVKYTHASRELAES
jgi:hypothetical protein